MPSQIAQLAQQAAGGIIGTGMGLLMEGHNDRRQLEQQQKLQDQQIAGNKQMVDYNMAKQLKMWKDTNFEAQMEHVVRAGLNPNAIFGHGGGGGITGTASGQVSGGEAPKGGGEVIAQQGMALNRELLRAQLENIQADTEKKKVEAAKTGGVDTELGKTQIGVLTQGIQNAKAQEALTRVQTEISQVQASIGRQTINEQMKAWENVVAKGEQEIKALKLDNSLSQQQMKDKVRMLKQEVLGQMFQNALTQAQGANTMQATEESKKRVWLMGEQAKKWASEVMIGWDSLENSNTDTRIKWTEFLNQTDFPKELVPMMSEAVDGVLKGKGSSQKPQVGFKW